MGRTRNILDLTMAGGAIAAVVMLSLPQFRQERSALQAISPAQAISTQVAEAPQTLETADPEIETQESLEIAHFLGIAQFVKNPTKYKWVCDADCGQASNALEFAKITEASLEGNQMTISYKTSVNGIGLSKQASAAKTGQLIGTLDSDGTFAGTYQVHSAQGPNEGSVTFTFAADGTAKSATGTAKIAQ